MGQQALTARLSPLTDDLVAALAAEPTGVSCDTLAARLHRRRADVLLALRGDPRLARTGTTRGTRWRLVAQIPGGTEWDGLDRGERGGRDHQVGRNGRGALGA
jgi:hypothetical protein